MNQMKPQIIPNHILVLNCIKDIDSYVVFKCDVDGEKTLSSWFSTSKLNRSRSDVIRGGYNDRDVNDTTPHVIFLSRD